MMSRWERYRALRGLGAPTSLALDNPSRPRFFQKDPERAELYRKLLALGYDEESSRKWSHPKFKQEGIKRIEAGIRRGAGYEFSFSPEIANEQDLEVKAKMALGLMGAWRVGALGEKKASLVAELAAEGKAAQDRGEDPNAIMLTILNNWRTLARQRMQEIPVEAGIPTEEGVMARELVAPARAALPSHVEEMEELLGVVEGYLTDEFDRSTLSPASRSLAVREGVQAARRTIEEGGSKAEMFVKVQEYLKGVLAKPAEAEVVRADNPTHYILEATNKKYWPYKPLTGKVDFVTFMVAAGKVAEDMGLPRPRTMGMAVSVLDKAGYKVMATLQ